MCNSNDRNTFEHFLIPQNIYTLKEKKYNKSLKALSENSLVGKAKVLSAKPPLQTHGSIFAWH